MGLKNKKLILPPSPSKIPGGCPHQLCTYLLGRDRHAPFRCSALILFEWVANFLQLFTCEREHLMFSKFGSGSVRPRQIFRIWLVGIRFEPNFENIMNIWFSCPSLALLDILNLGRNNRQQQSHHTRRVGTPPSASFAYHTTKHTSCMPPWVLT